MISIQLSLLRDTRAILDIQASFIFEDNTVTLDNYHVNTLVGGWGPCFVACMKKVLDTDGQSGLTIGVYGGLSFLGCGPCGVAAGVVFGVSTVGCAGGCVN